MYDPGTRIEKKILFMYVFKTEPLNRLIDGLRKD